jgi:hypothetical protein
MPAGQRPVLGRSQILREAHAVPPHRRSIAFLFLWADLAQDDVLGRHQDRIAAEVLDNLAQGGAEPCGWSIVGNPSARDRNAETELSIALLVLA